MGAALAFACLLALVGCAVDSTLPSGVTRISGGAEPATSSGNGLSASASPSASAGDAFSQPAASGSQASARSGFAQPPVSDRPADSSGSAPSEGRAAPKLWLEADLDHPAFDHGEKGARYQKYIVLHDTEGSGDPEDVVAYWERSESGVAAHFVVGIDGHIVQCVDMDRIAHHAGFGDTGHNDEYGVDDESRDDKVGTEPLGDWAADYGMNSYSVGIEMVHAGEQGEGYPEAQLKAVDALIAHIDAHYGDAARQSQIIDHKAWRTGNSDTSEEFADYLEHYQGPNRTHDGKPLDAASYDGKAIAEVSRSDDSPSPAG